MTVEELSPFSETFRSSILLSPFDCSTLRGVLTDAAALFEAEGFLFLLGFFFCFNSSSNIRRCSVTSSMGVTYVSRLVILKTFCSLIRFDNNESRCLSFFIISCSLKRFNDSIFSFSVSAACASRSS